MPPIGPSINRPVASVIRRALPRPENRPGKIKIREHLSPFDHMLTVPKMNEVPPPTE